MERGHEAIWSRGEVCEVCEGLYSGVEMRVVLNGRKSRWFEMERGLRQGCPLSPLLFNIYLMGMAEELERAQLGAGCWCRTLCMLMMFWWQTQGQSCRLCRMW